MWKSLSSWPAVFSLLEGSHVPVEGLLCARNWHRIIKSLIPISLSASSSAQPILYTGLSGILNKKEKPSQGIFLLALSRSCPTILNKVQTLFTWPQLLPAPATSSPVSLPLSPYILATLSVSEPRWTPSLCSESFLCGSFSILVETWSVVILLLK